MRIVILSRTENVHADMVQAYCEKHAQVDRANFDFDTHPLAKLPSVVLGETRFLQRNPDAFFVHHPRISYKPEWFKDEIERKLFVASWDSVKEWMEAQFPNALWINRPSKNAESRNILRQLSVARRLQLNVPETIFTNQRKELLRFASDDAVVIKQGNLGVNLERKRILTSLIDVKPINEEMLRGCPCLFQKYVPKAFELRVHVIGSMVLTCKIDSQASKKTLIDWRNYDLGNTPHEPYTLDVKIREQCVELVKTLGLELGILDLIVTPSGDCVFLECNAQGHWSWIEQLTRLPITEAICERLLRRGSK